MEKLMGSIKGAVVWLDGDVQKLGISIEANARGLVGAQAPDVCTPREQHHLIGAEVEVMVDAGRVVAINLVGQGADAG